MPLPRSTLSLVAAAIVLGGGYLIYDTVLVPRQETAETEAKDLFAFEEADIQSIQVITTQATVELMRSPEPPAPDPAAPDQSTATPTPEADVSNDGTAADDPKAGAETEAGAETGSAETDGTETDGTETGSAETGNAETGNAETDGAETNGAETGSAETDGAETDGAETASAETDGAETSSAEPSDPDALAVPDDLPPAQWQLVQPLPGPANDGSVAFLLNLLVTGASDRTLEVSADRAPEFGFDQPFATITVTLKDGSSHRLVLGSPDFNRTALYAQVDPPEAPTTLTVRLIPITFEQAVTRPLNDWQQPTGDYGDIQGLEDAP
ncbi:hypothetical protein [Prochlorothrix hollandica]|uniref:hypothetical protein n=1 Tax=Prochlorothrix hollandica TaxID=1223 RepID=UPI003341B756